MGGEGESSQRGNRAVGRPGRVGVELLLRVGWNIGGFEQRGDQI